MKYRALFLALKEDSHLPSHCAYPEVDPNNLSAEDPGAKFDAGKVKAAYLRQFEDAIENVITCLVEASGTLDCLSLQELYYCAVMHIIHGRYAHAAAVLLVHEGRVSMQSAGEQTAQTWSHFRVGMSEVAKLLEAGAKKYSLKGWMEVENGVERYEHAAWRHFLAPADTDNGEGGTGFRHNVQVCWNLLAHLTLVGRVNNHEKSVCRGDDTEEHY